MKRIIVAVITSLLVTASQLYAGGLSGLGVSNVAVAALETDFVCAIIAQTGEKIEYVNSGGFKIAKGDGHWMRFITFKDNLPFQAQAIIIDGKGVVSRKIVDVNPCEAPVKKAVVTRVKGGFFAKPPASEQGVQVSQAVMADEPAVVKAQNVEKPKKSGFHTRGALAAIDTLNISIAKFSPFNGEDKERHGENVNIKARFRPFEYGNLRFGAYGSYTDGSSDTYRKSKDQWSYSDYKTYGGGISGLYDHGDRLTSEADLGILWQDTESSTPAKNFRSWQDEKQLEARYKLASDYRRQNGELWAPYWELGAHYIHPFDVSYHDTKGGDDSYDNRRFRVWGNADLYDWYMGDANQWHLSPTLNAELGYLWGKDSGYLQGGLGSKLAWRGQEIIDLKFLNPRLMFKEDGSRLYDYIGTLKVDNALRAITAQQVKDYRPDGKK